MASPQRHDPSYNRGPEYDPELQRRDLPARRAGAGWFAWWWIWLLIILCAIWFAGWGWGDYGGWWFGNRGGVTQTAPASGNANPKGGATTGNGAANGATNGNAGNAANTTGGPGTGGH